MTMRGELINLGNRSKDVLVIEVVDADGNVQYRDGETRRGILRARLGRGRRIQVDSTYMGYSRESAPLVRIYAEHGDDDEYLGSPQIIVADEPRQDTS